MAERYIKTKGIILAARRFGELHRYVTLLSPDLGVIQAIAYGARKGKSKLSGWIEPFVSGVFNLYHNPVKKQYKIQDIDTALFAEFLRKDVSAYYLASFWAEVIISTYGGGGEYEKMYDLLLESLDTLNGMNSALIPSLFVQTVWRFLTILGYNPDLESCSECGKSLTDSRYVYLGSAAVGSIHCDNCRLHGELSLMQGARRYMEHTKNLSLQNALQIGLSSEALQGLSNFSKALIAEVIDKPIKTLQGGFL